VHTWVPFGAADVPANLAAKHPDCPDWLAGFSRHPDSPAVLASIYVPLLNGVTERDVIREWAPALAEEAEAAARRAGLDW
jgi:hypothetical protein